MATTKTGPKETVRRLLKLAGTTYAIDAGVSLKDAPRPLFQLLVLCMLASKPISAHIAVGAARELFAAGIRGADAALGANRADVIEAFGRAHYVRYDESSATRLVNIARRVKDRYGGDLRRLARDSGHDAGVATRLLKEFNGIGDTGADIFLREVQDTWTWLRPYFDGRTLAAARGLGLPAEPVQLATLAPRSCARLAAALIKVSLDDGLRERLPNAGIH